MSHQAIGSLISGVFGLVFVLVNTGSLSPGVALVLRGLAVAAFLALLVALRSSPGGEPAAPRGNGFGPSYGLVVLVEVVALFGGLSVIDRLLDAPQAGVAWVATVVGAHFFALGAVWSEPFFHRLGAGLLACGVAGLLLAAAGGGAPTIDVVGGVLPGALLLGAGLRGALSPGRDARTTAPRPRPPRR